MHVPATDIFGPALVIPEQFYSGVRETSESSGEKRLMFAILDDAVHSLQSYRLSKNRARRDEYDAAKAWVEATDVDWPFSFENICDCLGLDAEFFRDRLVRSDDANQVLELAKPTPRLVSLAKRKRALVDEAVDMVTGAAA